MKVKEILPVLERLGWLCRKDEAGDYFCLMDVDGAQVQVIPTIGKRSDGKRGQIYFLTCDAQINLSPFSRWEGWGGWLWGPKQPLAVKR